MKRFSVFLFSLLLILTSCGKEHSETEEKYDFSKEVYDLKNMSVDEIEEEMERLSRPKFWGTKSDLRNLPEKLPFKAIPKLDSENMLSPHYITFVFEPGIDRIDNIVYFFEENDDNSIKLSPETEIRFLLSDPNVATGLYQKIKEDYFFDGQEKKTDGKWILNSGSASVLVYVKKENDAAGDKMVYDFHLCLGKLVKR